MAIGEATELDDEATEAGHVVQGDSPSDREAEADELVRRWAQGAARSRRRREEMPRVRRRRRLARAACAGAVALVLGAAAAAIVMLPEAERGDRLGSRAAAAAAPLALPVVDSGEPARIGRPRTLPAKRQLADARAYAAARLGTVSFAVVDSRGDPHEMEGDRTFVTASVVKAMLLAAELDRLEASTAPLDSATRGYLERMITYSDNAAADLVYGRVGDAGLEAVAAEAGLEDFSVAGYWANAQLTASDMAKLMSRIEPVMAGPHSEYGLGVLERIVPAQRWGIPQALSGERLDDPVQGRLARHRRRAASPPDRPPSQGRAPGRARGPHGRQPDHDLRDRDRPGSDRAPVQPSRRRSIGIDTGSSSGVGVMPCAS